MSLWLSGESPRSASFREYVAPTTIWAEYLFISQVCQFCFNNIKNNMNGLCPACRRPYDEKTIEWKVVTPDEYVPTEGSSRPLLTSHKGCAIQGEYPEEPEEASPGPTTERGSETRSREREPQEPHRCTRGTKKPGLHYWLGTYRKGGRAAKDPAKTRVLRPIWQYSEDIHQQSKELGRPTSVSRHIRDI